MHTHDTLDAAGGGEPGDSRRLGPECQEALDTLYHFLDGELTDERRHQIQFHLDDCSSCLEVFDFEAELKIIVSHRCRERLPDALKRRVASALSDASKTFHGNE